MYVAALVQTALVHRSPDNITRSLPLSPLFSVEIELARLVIRPHFSTVHYFLVAR